MKQTFNQITKQKNPNFYPMGLYEETKGDMVKPDFSQFDRESNAHMLYNKYINRLDPLYTSLQPIYGILCRTFVKDQFYSSSGILKGVSTGKVEIQQMQRGGYVKDVVNAPYKFMTKAIVVAAPEQETVFKPGTIVAYRRIRQFAPVAGDNSVFDYDYSFVHPDSQLEFPPTSPTNRHYGYFTASRDMLLHIIEYVDVVEEYHNFADELEGIYNKSSKGNQE